MASKEIKAGDRLICIADNGYVKEGDIVTVLSTVHDFPHQNFYAVGHEYVYANQQFEHAYEEDTEGWLNVETYHAALMLFNDREAIEDIQHRFLKLSGLNSPECFPHRIKGNLPRGMEWKNVDVWALQNQVRLDLVEQGILSEKKNHEAIRALSNDGSTTCNKRIQLLKDNGFKTSDWFFDHHKARKGVEVVAKINTFKNGDVVRLRHDYMEVSSSGTEGNNYAIDDNMELNKDYTVKSAGADSLKVEGGTFWLNPRQFKLASDSPFTMSEEGNMKLTTKTVSYVNDKDAASYSALDQASLIEQAEAEIARLVAFKTKTKKVTALIAEMKADLKAAVAMFDAVED